MFAGDSEHVADTDIVATADINLFVTSPAVLAFLAAHPDMVAWVPQYDTAAEEKKGLGMTFNQVGKIFGLETKIYLTKLLRTCCPCGPRTGGG